MESGVFCENDVRAMVRLLGEVIAAPGDPCERRRLLMDGLCKLVGATSWIWCLAEFDAANPPWFLGFEHSGVDEKRFAGYIEALSRPVAQSETRPPYTELMDDGPHLTLKLLDQAATDGDLRSGVDIGPLLISQRPVDGGGTSGLAIYRESGATHFTDREERIARIILNEIPWLDFQALPDETSPAVTRLYPRHRSVLNLLGEGWNRKKIALHLGISENTVHGYVKEIFRHFGVHSQSELLARFSKGNGGEP